jgi:hypothetical protein
MDTFGDDSILPVRTLVAPQRAACAVNSVWKGNRLLTPAGGVAIRADQALAPGRLLADEDGGLAARYQSEAAYPSEDRWWWD